MTGRHDGGLPSFLLFTHFLVFVVDHGPTTAPKLKRAFQWYKT